MNKELLEKGTDVEDGPAENTYQRYSYPPERGGLGGIINEKDYNSALARLKEAEIKQEMPDKHHIEQVQIMVDFAGIKLIFGEHARRTVTLYSILRSDRPPEEVKPSNDQTGDQRKSVYHNGVSSNDAKPKVKRHHSEMTDQRILVEALRMLGDVESLDKMIKKYPNISFEYQRSGDK